MICKAIGTIEKYNLLPEGARVCVALSGGADSLCLLHALMALRERYALSLSAVHVNHNLRGESADRDEAFVRCICSEWGVPLEVFSPDVAAIAKKKGIGLEECGRAVRYEYFGKLDCDLIATAHTLSDSIETMIFNLLRGTGTKGLASIPPKREPNIIRPLIECTREEIEGYCLENNLQYVTDETNLSDDYTRNYIRHNIIPTFREVNTAFEGNISRTMEIVRSEDSFLAELATDLLARAETDRGYLTSVFYEAHPALRRRAIAKLLSDAMDKPAEMRHIALTDEAIISGSGKIQLGKGLYIRVDCDIISIQRHEGKKEVLWGREGNTFITPMGNFNVFVINNPDELLPDDIDADKLGEDYAVTPRKEGDTFYSKKRKLTKTLKKLFSEMKIPVEGRDLVPVLRNERGAVWVFGVGTDGNYLAAEGCKKIIRIKKEG